MSALYLFVAMVLGVQLIPAPAFAAATIAPTIAGGTCWKAGPPFWCSVYWEGTHPSPGNNGTGMFMKYNFNDHTDGDGGKYPNPRPDWNLGIAKAGDDWKLRRDKNNVWNQQGYDSSPILWQWTGFEAEMDVGFYVSTSGPVGSVRLYRTNGTYVTSNCDTPQDVAYAKVDLNKNEIDGTPGWFFETLVRHELGHAFGLCEAQGTEYKKSVMFPPHASHLKSGPSGCFHPYSCQSLAQDSIIAANAPWSQYPPWAASNITSDTDYGSPACPSSGTLTGTRCIYGW